MNNTGRNLWARRFSLYYNTEHVLDRGQKFGFDYHGKVIKKAVSPMFYENGMRTAILQTYDALICYIIDAIKYIKKFRNYAIDKRDIRLK